MRQGVQKIPCTNNMSKVINPGGAVIANSINLPRVVSKLSLAPTLHIFLRAQRSCQTRAHRLPRNPRWHPHSSPGPGCGSAINPVCKGPCDCVLDFFDLGPPVAGAVVGIVQECLNCGWVDLGLCGIDLLWCLNCGWVDVGLCGIDWLW